MSRLFDGYDIEEAEGVPVQYVGVYLLKWREHPEHPTMAFVESKYTTEMFDQLLAACEAMLEMWDAVAQRMDWKGSFFDGPTILLMNETPSKAKAAIANVKGE